jgi:hypothetical protein
LNITPWGETEAVIVTSFVTTATDSGKVPFYVVKKTVIRGNRKWFATIYYVTNAGPTSATSVRFFQGNDWNFNGTLQNDNCAYDSANDTVYGFETATAPTSYGGFSGFNTSVHHHVDKASNMWQQFRKGTLNDGNLYVGDAGIGMEWTLHEIDYGLERLHDVGIMEVTNPESMSVYQQSEGYVMLTATAVNYGLRDWNVLPVHVEITGPAGFTTIDTIATNVNLTIPDNEEKEVGYSFNISAVPDGLYTARFYTDLDNDMGLTDQNTSNNSKTVQFYVNGLTVKPEDYKVVNIGDWGNIDLTVSNSAGNDDDFEIEIISSDMFTGVVYPLVTTQVDEMIRANYDASSNKTFWLHGDDLTTQQPPAEHIYSLTMITDTAATTDGEGTAYTSVNRFAHESWSLSPDLTTEMIIENSFTASLVLSTNKISMSSRAG